MKKHLFISVFFVIAVAFSATAQNDYQKPYNQVVKDKTLQRDVLIGPCNYVGLKTNSLFEQAFNNEYNDYNPNTDLVNKIKNKINKTQIIIVFGSWCGDSRKQVGRFYKILDLSGFKSKHLSIIAVNRLKKAPGTKVASLNIGHIPSFIVNYKGKEIGRIVESPEVSLEADLAKILNKVH